MSYANSLFSYFIQSQYWISAQETLYTNTVMHYYISPACWKYPYYYKCFATQDKIGGMYIC